MVYKVIGLMSGSSLDGLDIAYVHLEEVRGKWSHSILHASCIPYEPHWIEKLRTANTLSVPDFLKLNTAYGKYTGECVNAFIAAHQLEHKIDFIASHGHTVLHEPGHGTTFQLGEGATIAATTGYTVINDLRAIDVALGGQGAPIVPVGDQLLFADHDYLLNIGGIANITIRQENELKAYDICPANQVLNALAHKLDKEYDDKGEIAASGNFQPGLFDELNNIDWYKKHAPKSLSNELAMNLVFPVLMETQYEVADLLHTMCKHIAQQVADAVKAHRIEKENASMLITGGGAFNLYLVTEIQKLLQAENISVVIPDELTIRYKEALVMALIGALRWREEVNVFSSVTGASRDSVGGAMWLG